MQDENVRSKRLLMGAGSIGISGDKEKYIFKYTKYQEKMFGLPGEGATRSKEKSSWSGGM